MEPYLSNRGDDSAVTMGNIEGGITSNHDQVPVEMLNEAGNYHI